MKAIIIIVTIISSVAVGHTIAHGGEIKIASWNVNNLEASTDWKKCKSDHWTPCRDKHHYRKLAKYAEMIDADVIALQEVNGQKAAEKIWDNKKYSFYFSKRDYAQKTGFAVKKNIKVTQYKDLKELNVDQTKRPEGQRYGTHIGININGQEIQLLSVHLKSRCWDDKLNDTKLDCQILKQQSLILKKWGDKVHKQKIPFIILGDFNRRFSIDEKYNRNNSMWKILNAENKLTRNTKEQKTKCWGKYKEFVDHIVFDQLAAEFIVPDSFEQKPFSGEYQNDRFKLSDHCSISNRMVIN